MPGTPQYLIEGYLQSELTDHSASGLVSIITIFLNEERFLGDAVESILAQTYRDWELLLCDDGSYDGSTLLAKKFASRFPNRIIYLDHPDHANLGMSATRNLGLKHARGRYVALLDGDDVWAPEMLERQVDLLRSHEDAVMVFRRSLYWHGWTGLPEDAQKDGLSRLPVSMRNPASGDRALRRILRGKGDAICTCAAIMRREAVTRVGGFESAFTDLFEDQVFFSKILLSGPVVVSDQPLDLYRQHPASSCAVGERNLKDLAVRRSAFLRWLKDYAAVHGASPSLRAAIRVELWVSDRPSLFRARESARKLAEAAAGRVTILLFTAGRRILPADFRRRLWNRWLSTLVESPLTPGRHVED